MKLIRLRSIAYNALRNTIWTPEPIGLGPFEKIRPREAITVDLVSGQLIPAMTGDDVERFYQAMTRWFHQALEKEGIPLEIIESAKLIISPTGRKCIIIADGKTFKAERPF